MKIVKAEMETSAVTSSQYPKDYLPEIALAGRSNVGKSSFINTLLGRKNLVRTSSKPGKTRTLNFFKINDSFRFVDVPGYGYAKVSKKERAAWGRMMEEYFESREPLQLVILIVDGRHRPTKDDLQMFEYVSYLDLPLLIIATKFDKVKQSQQAKQLKLIRETFQIDEEVPLIPFSSVKGTNKDKVWKTITKYV